MQPRPWTAAIIFLCKDAQVRTEMKADFTVLASGADAAS